MSEMNRSDNRTLMERLGKLNFLMHRYHQMNHRQHGPMGDPHRGQGRVLTLLSLREEISQRDLLYLLDMRPQSLGELLSKLERAGYIERKPSDEDKRVMLIRITEAGKQAASESDRPNHDELFECLSDAEYDELGGLLDKLIAAIEARPDMDGDAAYFARGRAGFPGDERGHGHGRGGFPGFGPDGMRRDGGFRELGGKRCGRCGRGEFGPEGEPEQV